jgi:hypothetical protein
VTDNIERAPQEDEVEGHMDGVERAPQEDDVEGHIDVPDRAPRDDDDVIGHVDSAE